MDTVGRLLGGDDGNAWENNGLVSVESRPRAGAIGALVCSDVLALTASVAITRLTAGPYTPLGTTLLLVGAFGYVLSLALLGFYPGRGMLGPTRIRLRAFVVLVTFVSPAVIWLLSQSPQSNACAAGYVGVGLQLFVLGAFFEILTIYIADAFGFWRSPAVFSGNPTVGVQVKGDLEIFPELGLELVVRDHDMQASTLAQLDTFGHHDRNPGIDTYIVDTASPLPVYYPLGRTSTGKHRRGKKVALVLKRIIDVVGSAVALVLCSPLLIVTAVCIYITDGRPIFFSQERGGLGETMFRTWKFRSMYRDAPQRLESVLETDPAARAEWNRYFKLRNDPRVLPKIGAFIRTTSIDELPQLWNVLNGEMSLVGPRPFPLNHLAAFSADFRAVRARAIPGISGLWQVTLRSNGDLRAQERLDRAYIESWSFWLDLYIIFRTPIALLTLHGAR